MDMASQCGRRATDGTAELRGNGMFVRRAALEAIGGWSDGALTEDLELSTRLVRARASRHAGTRGDGPRGGGRGPRPSGASACAGRRAACGASSSTGRRSWPARSRSGESSTSSPSRPSSWSRPCSSRRSSRASSPSRCRGRPTGRCRSRSSSAMASAPSCSRSAAWRRRASMAFRSSGARRAALSSCRTGWWSCRSRSCASPLGSGPADFVQTPRCRPAGRTVSSPADLVICGQVVLVANRGGLEAAEADRHRGRSGRGRRDRRGRARRSRTRRARRGRPRPAVIPGIHDFHIHLVGLARARRHLVRRRRRTWVRSPTGFGTRPCTARPEWLDPVAAGRRYSSPASRSQGWKRRPAIEAGLLHEPRRPFGLGVGGGTGARGPGRRDPRSRRRAHRAR